MLVSRNFGPFSVLQVMNHTVMVDTNAIQNVVYIDRVALARKTGEAVSATGDVRQGGAQQHNGSSTSHNEYAVERIVNQAIDDDGTKQPVRGYSYISADDTSETPENIPQHLYERY